MAPGALSCHHRQMEEILDVPDVRVQRSGTSCPTCKATGHLCAEHPAKLPAPQHSTALVRLREHRPLPLIEADNVAGRVEPSARIRRQIGLVRIGRHPISLYLRRAFSTGLPLHTLAPRQIDASGSEYRCGTCRFAAPLDAAGFVSPPPGRKLSAESSPWARTVRKCFRWPELVTRGNATNIRLMWPACRNWLPRVDEDVNPPVGSSHTATTPIEEDS